MANPKRKRTYEEDNDLTLAVGLAGLPVEDKEEDSPEPEPEAGPDNLVEMELEPDMNLDDEEPGPFAYEPVDASLLGAGAGQPITSVAELLIRGKKQGYVTHDQILQVVPEPEANIQQIEEVYAELLEQGIEVRRK